MPGLTLMERYYGINEKLNQFLQSRYSDLKIYKYGVNPALLKSDLKKSEKIYPYGLSYLTNINEKGWTSLESGIYTTFNYQVNYFTSPNTEFTNDSNLYKPFDLLKLALTDVNLKILEIDGYTLADIQKIETSENNFNVVSGAIVPSRILIAKMSAVCGYPESIPQPTLATDTSKALTFN